MNSLTRRSWILDSVLILALLVVSAGLLSSCASMSPLITASENGNIAEVNALLAKGADVNAKENDDATALTGASAGDPTGIRKKLFS